MKKIFVCIGLIAMSSVTYSARCELDALNTLALDYGCSVESSTTPSSTKEFLKMTIECPDGKRLTPIKDLAQSIAACEMKAYSSGRSVISDKLTLKCTPGILRKAAKSQRN